MQSKCLTVDDFFKEVPPERLTALTRLRDLCREILTGYKESMVYGMPGYTKDGTVEIGFNSQKHFIAFYVLKKEVLDQYRHHFSDLGKGCIRFSKPEKIDFAVVKKLLEDTRDSSSPIC